MLQRLLDRLNEDFPLKEKKAENDKVSKMNFIIRQYYAEGLGNVSTMTASGFFGLMKMDTLVINPFEKDAPLLSYDRIHAFGNDSLYFEMFETRIDSSDKPGYIKDLSDLKGKYDFEVKPTWYEDILYKESIHKKAKKKNSADLDKTADSFYDAYLKWLKEAKACNKEEKKAKARVYTEGLLENGGPSTDVWVKEKGLEYTKKFFREVLFGTE